METARALPSRRISTCAATARNRLEINHGPSTALLPHGHAQAPGYNPTWTQNTEEVLLRVPVDQSIKGRDVQFEAHPKRLQLQVKGEDVVSGSLSGAGEIDIDGGWLQASGCSYSNNTA